MALIKCPECGKEISDKAKSCPNCGAPVLPKVTQPPVKYIAPPPMVKNNMPEKKKGSCLKSICIFFGVIIILGVISNLLGGGKDNAAEKKQESFVETEESVEEIEDPVIETEEVIEASEETESNEKFDSPKDAFKQGFKDNFNISDENKENIESIKNSVDEIWNDEEVQESYDNYKESVKNLIGKS